MMTSRRLRAILVSGAAWALAVGCVSGCSRGPVGVPAGGSIAGNAITGTAPPLTVLTRDTSGGDPFVLV